MQRACVCWPRVPHLYTHHYQDTTAATFLSFYSLCTLRCRALRPPHQTATLSCSTLVINVPRRRASFMISFLSSASTAASHSAQTTTYLTRTSVQSTTRPSTIASHRTVRVQSASSLPFTHVLVSGPLCNTPVAIPPGQDPNVRMERHINTECSVMTGKTKASSGPHCAKAKCGKVLFAPIRCDVCGNILLPWALD